MVGKKHIIILISVLVSVTNVHALTREQGETMQHEFRVGYGDMIFETLMWPKNNYRYKVKYTGHIFAEYQYHLFNWLSTGLQVDYERVAWHLTSLGMYFTTGPRQEKQHFYNLTFLPTIRATYFHHPYLNLYSAFGFGVNINGGTERDMYDRTTATSMAFNLTLLGMKAGKNHWFVGLELGALNAFQNEDFIYMIASRIFSISVGYNF